MSEQPRPESADSAEAPEDQYDAETHVGEPADPETTNSETAAPETGDLQNPEGTTAAETRQAEEAHGSGDSADQNPEPPEQDRRLEPDESPEPDQSLQPDQDHAADQDNEVMAAEPPRVSMPTPIIATPQATPDKGLSEFFDTLDERAKNWWSERQSRKEHQANQAQGNEADPETLAPADDTEPGNLISGLDEDPQAQAAAPGAFPAAVTSAGVTGRISLPKPPPVDQRPPGRLHTGALPKLQAAAEQRTPPSQAPEPPAADLASEQVPPPQGVAAHETTVLPPYREDTGDDAAPEPTLPSSVPPWRQPRRTLDEQRRRNVIMQKAAAIEEATAGNAAPAGDTELSDYEFADDEEDLYTYIPPYNLPSRDPDPEPTYWDLARRVFLSVGAAGALASAMWMLGWFTSNTEENPAVLFGGGLTHYSAGWFSGDYALLSPDHNWYWAWPVIAVALCLHAAFAWTATQESTPRQQRSGWLVGSASLLMLIITAGLHTGQITLVTLASLAAALALLEAIRQFNQHTARNQLERRMTDAIVGVFFGFSLVQAMSAVSVRLTSWGWEIPGFPALLWALAGLFICVWAAAFYSMTERGRITIALGLGWGMFWLIFPRLLAEVTSVWVAIGAAMGAFIVILSTQSRRHRINHAERRAAMGRPLEDII